jgi:O-antigen/teichoic acid export membrane protein
MIKEMLGEHEVGIFSAAVRLSEVWYFIPTLISASLYPAILNAKKISEESYYNRIQKLYTLVVWIAIAIALPITLIADWLVSFLYGGKFCEASAVLKINIWSGVFGFMGIARGKWILNENLQIYTSIYLGFALITNVTINYYLIPKMGIIGAAYSTLFAQIMAALIGPAFFKKTRRSSVMLLKAFLLYR